MVKKLMPVLVFILFFMFSVGFAIDEYDDLYGSGGEKYYVQEHDEYTGIVLNQSGQQIGVLNYDSNYKSGGMGVVTNGEYESSATEKSMTTIFSSFTAGSEDTRHFLQKYYNEKNGRKIMVQFWYFKKTPESVAYGAPTVTDPYIYDVRIGVTTIFTQLDAIYILKSTFYVVNKGNMSWSVWKQLESILKSEYGSSPALYYRDNAPYISSW